MCRRRGLIAPLLLLWASAATALQPELLAGVRGWWGPAELARAGVGAGSPLGGAAWVSSAVPSDAVSLVSRPGRSPLVAGGEGDEPLHLSLTGSSSLAFSRSLFREASLPVTVGVRFRTNSTVTSANLVGSASASAANASRWGLGIAFEGGVAVGHASNDVPGVLLRSPAALNDGQWHSVFFVASHRMSSLFVDGRRVAYSLEPPKPYDYEEASLGHTRSGSSGWSGDVSHLAVVRAEANDDLLAALFAAFSGSGLCERDCGRGYCVARPAQDPAGLAGVLAAFGPSGLGALPGQQVQEWAAEFGTPGGGGAAALRPAAPSSAPLVRLEREGGPAYAAFRGSDALFFRLNDSGLAPRAVILRARLWEPTADAHLAGVSPTDGAAAGMPGQAGFGLALRSRRLVGFSRANSSAHLGTSVSFSSDPLFGGFRVFALSASRFGAELWVDGALVASSGQPDSSALAPVFFLGGLAAGPEAPPGSWPLFPALVDVSHAVLLSRPLTAAEARDSSAYLAFAGAGTAALQACACPWDSRGPSCELNASAADPSQLAGLVAAWQGFPSWLDAARPGQWPSNAGDSVLALGGGLSGRIAADPAPGSVNYYISENSSQGMSFRRRNGDDYNPFCSDCFPSTWIARVLSAPLATGHLLGSRTSEWSSTLSDWGAGLGLDGGNVTAQVRNWGRGPRLTGPRLRDGGSVVAWSTAGGPGENASSALRVDGWPAAEETAPLGTYPYRGAFVAGRNSGHVGLSHLYIYDRQLSPEELAAAEGCLLGSPADAAACSRRSGAGLVPGWSLPPYIAATGPGHADVRGQLLFPGRLACAAWSNDSWWGPSPPGGAQVLAALSVGVGGHVAAAAVSAQGLHVSLRLSGLEPGRNYAVSCAAAALAASEPGAPTEAPDAEQAGFGQASESAAQLVVGVPGGPGLEPPGFLSRSWPRVVATTVSTLGVSATLAAPSELFCAAARVQDAEEAGALLGRGDSLRAAVAEGPTGAVVAAAAALLGGAVQEISASLVATTASDTDCSNGILEEGEDCVPPGPCCDSSCRFVPALSPCSSVPWLPCAEQPVCSGTSAECPVPALHPPGTPCSVRQVSWTCAAASSFCNGTSAVCPPGSPLNSSTVCRPSAPSSVGTLVASCDPPESCDGVGIECPPDVRLPNGTSCAEQSTCAAGECVCEPLSCSALGFTCGRLALGCGITFGELCGLCPIFEACSNMTQCLCSPAEGLSCAALSRTCGVVHRGCLGPESCGACGVGQVCRDGRCADGAPEGCVPSATCDSGARTVGGRVFDGCSWVDCGDVPNADESPEAAAACEEAGANCGVVVYNGSRQAVCGPRPPRAGLDDPDCAVCHLGRCDRIVRLDGSPKDFVTFRVTGWPQESLVASPGALPAALRSDIARELHVAEERVDVQVSAFPSVTVVSVTFGTLAEELHAFLESGLAPGMRFTAVDVLAAQLTLLVNDPDPPRGPSAALFSAEAGSARRGPGADPGSGGSGGGSVHPLVLVVGLSILGVVVVLAGCKAWKARGVPPTALELRIQHEAAAKRWQEEDRDSAMAKRQHQMRSYKSH